MVEDITLVVTAFFVGLSLLGALIELLFGIFY